MIISFRFKNFRSFPDETFIDMRAVGYKEHPSHLIAAANKKLIKTLAVYGANSSGKTNLFLAFASFHSLIFWHLFSLDALPRNHFMSLLQLSNMNKIIPYQSDETSSRPTEMEISFISGNRVFEYGFSVCDQKILTEHMAVDHHLVFTRNGEGLSIGRQYEKFLRQKSGLRPHDNRLFCSVLSCLDTAEIAEIMEPFENFFSKHIIYHYDFLEPFQMAGHMVIDGGVYNILENQEALEYGLSQLQKLGIPAVDFTIDNGIPKLGYRFKSRMTGQYQTHYMDFRKVSTGTMKYLSLFAKFHSLSQKGGVLIIDTISNELHPAVTKSIVDSFQQDSNKNIQLIFTTYDVSILNNQQFRRDEVAFVDINEYQESRLYTLADIKVRSDASFSKDYLLGKYGAVPLVKDSFI
ncbi:ATP-binding protein [Lachnospiraceae bacterium 54-53]